MAIGREKTSVLGQLLHLSKIRPATAQRVKFAYRRIGTDQRALRRGQNRRNQTLRNLPRSVRSEFHFGHAYQPVRTERQLRPRELACIAGAHP